MKPFLISGAAGRLVGVWNVCCVAFSAYVGTELLGIAADEMERQRETIPKVVRRTSFRIVFYYIGAVFVLGLNVSANDRILESNYLSPRPNFTAFALMVERAGLPALAHVIYAVALIAALSVANIDLYISVSHVLFQSNFRVERFTRWQVKIRLRLSSS